MVTDIRMPPGMHDEGIVAAGLIRAETGGRTAVLVLSQYLQLDFAIACSKAATGRSGIC